jgi:hypothetical protein
MFFVSLDRHGLELFFVAALDPQSASLFDGRRYAARRVQPARNVVARFYEPRFAVAFASELLCATDASAVSIRGSPANKAGWQNTFSDRGH